MPVKQLVYYLALGAFFLVIAVSLTIHFNVQSGYYLEFLGLQVITQYMLAAVLMLLVWWSAPDQPQLRAYWLLIVIAVIVRLLLLFVEPYTSNDVDRYLFDGRIALEGLDPYRISHDVPELQLLREQWAPPPEHAKYTTLYPPLALGLFSLSASFEPEGALWVWKLLTTAAGLCILLLGCLVLRQAKMLRHLPLLALSPLLILETGEGLHLDVFSGLAVIAAIYYWQSRRMIKVGICLALGGLLKMLPVLLVLPLLMVAKNWRQRIELIVSTLFVWLGGYGFAWLLGFQPLGSLTLFFEKWRSGSPFFLWLEPYISGLPMLFLVLTLLVLGLFAVAGFLWRSTRRKSHTSTVDDATLYSCMQIVMVLPLLFSPVIFPWYLLPLIPLLSLKPNMFLLFWIICLPFLYEVLGQFTCCQYWAPANWPVHLIGVGLILGLLIDVARSMIKNTQPFVSHHRFEATGSLKA